MILLINPPVVKPCEPPAGIAALAGNLQRFGAACVLLDANLEGLLYLLTLRNTAEDTWTKRAYRHLDRHARVLRSWRGYENPDRYRRAVYDINRVLASSAGRQGVRLTLADYQDSRYAPVRSRDLVKAAEEPEKNVFYPYFRERISGLLDRIQPKLIGISLNYLSQAVCAFALIGFVRKQYPDAKIILGGGLVTSWMHRPGWKNPFDGLIDLLVAGPGEQALLSLAGIDSDATAACLPAYELLPTSDYLAPGLILPYSASRGCYWNKCSFCPERAEGNPYRPLPSDQVVAGMQSMAAYFKPVLINLVDNALSPALLKALSSSSVRTPWYGFARITPQLKDKEYCNSLRAAGCVMIKLGVESGDQAVLDSLQKGVSCEDASQALHSLTSSGIATYVYLLFGTPAETEPAARRTLDFVVSHGDCISFLNLALFNMPLYGPEAASMATRTFSEGDLSLYADFVHPAGWSRPLVRDFLDKEFKRHPAVASMLRRQPPFFTSNHAPLFVMAEAMKAVTSPGR